MAQLYQQRWQVELFFRWLKQHLRIKVFYGKSIEATARACWLNQHGIQWQGFDLDGDNKTLSRLFPSNVRLFPLNGQADDMDELKSFPRSNRFRKPARKRLAPGAMRWRFPAPMMAGIIIYTKFHDYYERATANRIAYAEQLVNYNQDAFKQLAIAQQPIKVMRTEENGVINQGTKCKS